VSRVGVCVGEQWFWQPRADVGLASRSRRTQVVDGDSGRDGGRISLGGPYGFDGSAPSRIIGERDPIGCLRGTPGRQLTAALQPQVSVLDDVLGLTHAADHAIGDREHQRPQCGVVTVIAPLIDLDVWHVSAH
jgi:hypothetical protein